MKKGFLYIALAAFFFSTMEIALKLVSAHFNPLQLNFIRFLVGAVVLLPMAIRSLRRRSLRLSGGDLLFFALTGFICVVVSMTFYQLAVVAAPASIVAILFSCNPVFVVPLAALILRERVRALTLVSMLVSLTGMVCIMDPFQMSASAQGIALTILAAASFALYGVIGKKRTARYGGVALTAFSFLAGSVELLCVIGLTHIPAIAAALQSAGLGQFASVPILHGVTWASLPGLFYIGVFVTGLGYAFYLLSMEVTSAAMASTVFFIKPALAPLLAFAVLKEPLTANMAAGIALILAGSLMTLLPALRGGSKKHPPQESSPRGE